MKVQETSEATSEATQTEASLAFLNAIDDAASVLASHLKNQELKEAEEILFLLAEQITEFRTFLLEEAQDEKE